MARSGASADRRGNRDHQQPHGVDGGDPEYLRRGITEWLSRWQANGWRTAGRKPVRNQDLWQELLVAMAPHDVTWHWVRGHAGHPENTRVDRLARGAMQEWAARAARTTPSG